MEEHRLLDKYNSPEHAGEPQQPDEMAAKVGVAQSRMRLDNTPSEWAEGEDWKKRQSCQTGRRVSTGGAFLCVQVLLERGATTLSSLNPIEYKINEDVRPQWTRGTW